MRDIVVLEADDNVFCVKKGVGVLRVAWINYFTASMTCFAATGALAETSPADAIGSAVALATSWPSDMASLPVFRGEADTIAPVQLNHLQGMGLELNGKWYGYASVKGPLRSPDLYRLSCKRVGADILAYVRTSVAEGSAPEALLYVFSSNGERETLANLIPKNAEAAMVCEHVYRVDSDEVATAREAVQNTLEERFANVELHQITGAIRDFVSTGWTGDTATGIALMEVSVSDEIMVAGKVDIFIKSYSWLLP